MTIELKHSLLLLPTVDLLKTSEWYVKNLGFKAKSYLNVKEPHICLYKDSIEIVLLKSKLDKIIPNRKLHGYGYDGYFTGLGIAELYNEILSKKSVKIIRRLKTTDYNNQEFVIEDIDGRWICFGKKKE